jgi:O-antigen/teichoic acid export membrane protein
MELVEILFSVFQLLIAMGVSDVLSRFYYAEKEQTARDHVVSTVLINYALVGLPFVLVFLTWSPLLSRAILEDSRYLSCLQVAIATAWFGMLCEVGFTYLRMRYMAKTFVAVTTVQLAAALSLNIYFIVFLRWDVFGIFLSTFITQSLTGVLLAIAILRRVGFYFSFTALGRLVAFGLPLVPAQIVQLLGYSANCFFLRWFGAADVASALALVGILSLGQKFGAIVNRFINVPFNQFWSPRRLELLLSGEAHAKETVARICTYASSCSVVIALLLAATISPVLAIMADQAYRDCQIVVPFAVLAQVIAGLDLHFRTGILYCRKTVWDTIISIPTLGVIVAWNLVLIPRYGLIAAATSNLAGYVIRVGLAYVVSQRLYPLPFELGRLAKLLITALVVYALTQEIAFQSAWATLIARMAMVGLFPISLVAVGFYREGELEFISRSLRQGWKALRALAPGV